MNTKKLLRQKSALSRLEKQLISGVKNTKEGIIPLNEKDTKRIKNEIQTLKSK